MATIVPSPGGHDHQPGPVLAAARKHPVAPVGHLLQDGAGRVDPLHLAEGGDVAVPPQLGVEEQPAAAVPDGHDRAQGRGRRR